MMEPLTHKYTPSPRDDRDDSSLTEVESLMDEQKWTDEALRRPAKRNWVRTILKAFTSSLNTLLLVTILALFLHEHYFNPDHDKHEKERPDFGGDMTGVGPKCTSTSLFRPSLLVHGC
jgi:hypothetical protein